MPNTTIWEKITSITSALPGWKVVFKFKDPPSKELQHTLDRPIAAWATADYYPQNGSKEQIVIPLIPHDTNAALVTPLQYAQDFGLQIIGIESPQEPDTDTKKD